jgi:hypothetical protein
MITRWMGLALALVLMAPAAADSGDGPGTYAERTVITTMPGQSLQRVRVPARVLVAARSADLADMRIFDANGQAVPMALSTIAPPRQRLHIALPVLPILGPVDALAVTGVSLRIDDRQRTSVVRVDGTPQRADASQLLGVLLDTRRISDPVSGLVLDLAIPPGQPVTFTIESSADLKTWQTHAEKVIYRAGGQSEQETIGFPAQELQGDYLRVTWQASSRLLSPVAVRSAEAVTTRNSRTDQAPRVVLLVPAPKDRHAIEFTVPFVAAMQALEIEPGGADTVVPIRILGRNQNEQPWAPVTSGSLFRVTGQGGSRANPAFDLHGARWRTLRVEADERSAGFAAAPKFAARLEPVELVFLATGSAPYTLVAGKVGAASTLLPLNDLLQANGSSANASLPLAATPTGPDPVLTLAPPQQGMMWRRVALWGVLLAATALLATLVWLLVRRREPAP